MVFPRYPKMLALYIGVRKMFRLQLSWVNWIVCITQCESLLVLDQLCHGRSPYEYLYSVYAYEDPGRRRIFNSRQVLEASPNDGGLVGTEST